MSDKTLWSMEDVKVLRKTDANLEIELIGIGWGVKFKYTNIKKMDSEFSKYQKAWEGLRQKNQKYNVAHQKQHEKLAAKQEKFLDVAKKAFCK